MRREEDREVPLEAVFQVGGAVAHRVVRPDRDVALLAGAVVDAADEAAVVTAVDDVGVVGLGGEPAALGAGRRLPVALVDAAAVAAAEDADGGVVLLGAVDAVRE